MSPPIYTPDGSEVSEIVLPDGSTASEVIGPDGNVVFEAGPDIPDSVIDDFEDGDLSEYSGNDGSFSISTSTSISGSNGLNNDNSGFNNVLSSSSVPNLPVRGDPFGFFVQWPINDVSFAFAYSADTQTYGVGTNGSTELRIYKNGQSSSDAVTTTTVSTSAVTNGDWVEFFVDFGHSTNDEITVTLHRVDDASGPSGYPIFDRTDELATLTTTDTEYDSGGVGWWDTNNNGPWTADLAINFADLI